MNFKYADFVDRIDPVFGHWLAGFIDGEGCFQIHRYNKNTSAFRCGFALSLRDDDSNILNTICAKTLIGKVSYYPGRNNANPYARWSTHNKEDCKNLVMILDRFPLQSKKFNDFIIWKQGVALWNSGPYDGKWLKHANMTELNNQMLQLQIQLRQGRKYEITI